MRFLKNILAVSVFVLAATSCIKDNMPENTNTDVATYPATLSISEQDAVDVTKASLDGETLRFTWNTGDRFAILGCGTGNTINEFITQDNDVFAADFDGNVVVNEGAEPSMWVGVNPYSSVVNFSSINGNTTVSLPSSQSGRLEDVGNYYISIAQSGNPILDSDGEGYDFYMENSLTPFTSVVKFNLPESLEVTRIVVSAVKAGNPCGIAGEELIKLNAGDVCKNSPVAGETEIHIYRDADVISGDVYVCILPDLYKENPRIYKSSAESLTFRLEKNNGAYWEKTVTIDADHPITAGKLMNFGSIPASIQFAKPHIEAPVLSYTADNKLVATHDLPNVRFYYTTDPLCEPEDPTTASPELPAEGAELTSTQYIKVIAELDGAVSEVAEANLKYWDRSEVTDAGLKTIPANGSYPINSWLYLTTTDGAVHTGVDISTSGITSTSKTPYICFNVNSETDGTGSMFVKLNYNSSKRYIVAYIDETQIIHEGSAQLKPTNKTFVKLGEGEITMGTTSYMYFSHINDGGAMYTFAFFETGNVNFPTPTCQTPEISYGTDGMVNAVSTNGATIYYTTGDVIPADPTTASDVFPAEGLKLASGTYIKTLAVKDGYRDSEISTSLIRTWNYTQLAPLFPEGTDLKVSGEYQSTHDLCTASYVSAWITLTSTNTNGAKVLVKGGAGWRYPTSTLIHFTNQLTGNAKLYVKNTSGNDSQAVWLRPSSASEYSSLGAGIPDNVMTLAAESAISAGETSDFYLTKGNRLESIVLLETGVANSVSGLANQSFNL